MSETRVTLMRNSERSTFRDCMLRWDWVYNRRLQPVQRRGALEFGTLVHEALAERYPPGRKRGVHPSKTFERLYKEHRSAFSQWDEEGNRIDALELGVAMLDGYVDEYGEDDHIEIIAPEMPLSVDVYGPTGKFLCRWVGRGDAMYVNLARSTSRRRSIGFMEHKTAKSIEEDLSIISGYGEQGLSYWWAGSIVMKNMGLLKGNEQIEHVLFNWLRKALPDQRPRNAQGHRLNKPTKDALLDRASRMGVLGSAGKKPTVDSLTTVLELAGVDVALLGEPSKTQPATLFHRQIMDFGDSEKESINRRIRHEAWMMARAREGKLPILKNPSKDCSWKCAFRDACEVHEMGGDWESILELDFEEWNPYSDHEIQGDEK